ncbi:MAG: class I SAM-dependent methyltransferase [Lysobacterales bacterium]|jgi:ubiquinone/menaquinone biosynthesis C-methylase UbiE
MATIAKELPLQADLLEQFAGKVMEDIGGAFSLLLAFMGDQTGIYRSLRDDGPATSVELARRCNVDERYLREWLSAQAAAGYVDYLPGNESFSLAPEKATVLAAEGDPACLQGFVQQIVAQFSTYEQAIDVFCSGAGRDWSEHHSCCFCATDRLFNPGYTTNLVSSWLPALDGVESKLRAGAKVADIGCGLGSSTVLMAEAYPNSVFHGFDFHPPSIKQSRQRAAELGVSGNTRFEALTAKEIPNDSYDLVCMFDALHDMGDPVGAARHIRECLTENGTLMLVEPLAGDELSDNLHLVGQIFYAASTLVCTPASKAQEVGLALGSQAGQARLEKVLREAGFTRIRRATETETNMVLEARP